MKIKYLILILIILSAIFIRVIKIDTNYVGQFNDDAWYINASRWMAGTQRIEKELTSRPIGLPVLMLPIARFFPENNLPFQIYSLFFNISILVLLFLLLKDTLKKNELLILILIAALNPLSLILSSSVMPENPYIFFTFLVIFAFKKLDTRCNEKTPVIPILPVLLLSFLLAVLFYLKTAGAAMFISVIIYFFYGRKYKIVLYLTFFYLLLILPNFIFLPKDPVDKYLWERFTLYQGGTFFESVRYNTFYYIKNISLSLIFFSSQNSGTGDIFSVNPGLIFSVAVIGFMGYSLFKYDRLKPDILKLYIPLYLLIHIFWVNVASRYFYVLYPFLFIYFFSYLKKLNKYIYGVIVAAVLITYAVSNTQILLQRVFFRIYNPRRTTFQTYRWIENNIDDKVIMSNYRSRIFLKTGKKIENVHYNSPDELYKSAVIHNVNYICIFSERYLQDSINPSISVHYNRLRSFLKNIDIYEMVYINRREETAIVKIDKSKVDQFKDAYEKMIESQRKFLLGKKLRAIELLKEAIATFPVLIGAYRELAAIYLTQKEYEAALKVLRDGLLQYPEDPYLFAFIGRIYKEIGEMEEAHKNWEKALRLADGFGLRVIAKQVDSDLNPVRGRTSKMSDGSLIQPASNGVNLTK